MSGSEEQLGDAILSVDPNKPEEMAFAMLSLVNDESLRQSLRRKGLVRAESAKPLNYVSQVCILLDEIEPMQRSWRNGYLHP